MVYYIHLLIKIRNNPLAAHLLSLGREYGGGYARLTTDDGRDDRIQRKSGLFRSKPAGSIRDQVK